MVQSKLSSRAEHVKSWVFSRKGSPTRRRQSQGLQRKEMQLLAMMKKDKLWNITDYRLMYLEMLMPSKSLSLLSLQQGYKGSFLN